MLNKFNKESLVKYPNPHEYSSVSQRVLWSLFVMSNELNLERARISHISKFLTDVIEIDTSPQAVRYALKNLPRGYVNKTNKFYKLMARGKKQITRLQKKPDSMIINPGADFSSKVILSNNILSLSEGYLKICDPYISVRLLDLLIKVDKKVEIKILSFNLADIPNGIFKRAQLDLSREGYDIKIRLYNKSELHDRYIISKDFMWVVGHSIKDLGKKECFVMQVGEDIKIETEKMFERRWKISNDI